MKFPKKVKRYCPHCKKHTEMKLIKSKRSGRRGSLRQGQRRHKRRSGVKGYGSFPQPKLDKGVKYGVKRTKKTDFRYQCLECKRMITPSGSGKRLGKVEVSR